MNLIIFLGIGIIAVYLIDKILKNLTTPRCPRCGKILLTRYILHKAPTHIEDGLEEKILYCECGYEKRIKYPVPYWKIIRKEGFRGFEIIPWTDLYKKEEVDQATAESQKRDSEESPNTTGQGAG